jgi:hypothetical protein
MAKRKLNGKTTEDNVFGAAAYLESIQPQTVPPSRSASPRLSIEDLTALVQELRPFARQSRAAVPEKFKAVFEQDDLQLRILGDSWDSVNTEYAIDWWLAGHDPAKEQERFISWHDQTRNARAWFDMPDVSPRDAAMVLCRLNPLEDEDPERIYVDDDKSSPERYRLLLAMFESVARATPKHRTLMEWRAIAREMGLRYHEWVDEYARATGRDVDVEQGALREDSVVRNHAVKNESSDERAIRLYRMRVSGMSGSQIGALEGISTSMANRVSRRGGEIASSAANAKLSLIGQMTGVAGKKRGTKT